MVMGNLACLVHGATMVYPSEGFDPLAMLRAVETEQCTALYGVPTMFIAELAQQELAHFDLSSLRSGQPAPPRLLDVGGETPRSPAGIHFPRRE
jgi:fatty-acyl-CoA synthase